MQLEVHDGVMDDVQCASILERVQGQTFPYLDAWRPGKGHVGVHAQFPDLVNLLSERFGLPDNPGKQMCLLDPPGSRGVRPHRHDCFVVLFYPKTHQVGLTLDPPECVDVVGGRAIFIPEGTLHSVGPNHTDDDRYCVPIVYEGCT